MFQKYLKPRFEAEFRLRGSSKGEAEVFMDKNGLPANGDLTGEIQGVITRTVFLMIFVGRSYPNSVWCGKELELFTEQFLGARIEALERTFIIVLDRAAEQKDWGRFLDRPDRPIFERFYDEETGHHFPPMLEDRNGQAVAGPRVLRGIRKIAETMAERAVALRTELHEI